MKDKDLVTVMVVKDATGWLDNLTVTGPAEFLRLTATLRMLGKLIDVAEYAFDKLCRRGWTFQCNVVGDGIKIAQCRLRPNYFSHRARRFLACV